MPVVATVVAVPLLAWSAYAFVSNDHPSTARSSDPASSPSVVTPNPTNTSYEEAREARQVVDDCAARITAAEAVVAEGATGVGHWHEHVQARTDLLTGRITQADTKAIWKRTRLAGPDDLTRFNAAMTTYNAAPACGAAAQTVPDDLRAALDACVARATKSDAAVAAAAAAIGDWQGHLNAMAAHAHGDMTAAQAQEMWVAAWEAAPTNIEAFNNARDALAQAPACTGAGS